MVKALNVISRFGERFRDGQCSLVSLLFAVLLTVPLCPAICKSGGTCPRPPWSRRHCTPLTDTTYRDRQTNERTVGPSVRLLGEVLHKRRENFSL